MLSAIEGRLASAVAGGGVASTVVGELASAIAGGLVLVGGFSFGGGEATSRTKVFLGSFDFCLLVADFFLGMENFFLRGGSEAELAALFLDFVFTVFIEFSSLSLHAILPFFLSH